MAQTNVPVHNTRMCYLQILHFEFNAENDASRASIYLAVLFLIAHSLGYFSD